jgi:hypothetical protein
MQYLELKHQRQWRVNKFYMLGLFALFKNVGTLFTESV